MFAPSGEIQTKNNRTVFVNQVVWAHAARYFPISKCCYRNTGNILLNREFEKISDDYAKSTEIQGVFVQI